jgi:hypothetical protein
MKIDVLIGKSIDKSSKSIRNSIVNGIYC